MRVAKDGTVFLPTRFWLTRGHGGSFGFACQSVLQVDTESWRRCGARTDAILHIGGNDIQQAICNECLRVRHPGLLEVAAHPCKA